MEEQKQTKRFEIPRKASIGVTAIVSLSTIASAASDNVRLSCTVGIVIVSLYGLTLQFNSERKKKTDNQTEDNLKV